MDMTVRAPKIRLPARPARRRILLTPAELKSIRAALEAPRRWRRVPSWFGVGVSTAFYAVLATAYTLWPHPPSRAVTEGTFDVAVMARPALADAREVDARQAPEPLEAMAVAMLAPPADPLDSAPPPEYVPPPDAAPAEEPSPSAPAPSAAAAAPFPSELELAAAVVPISTASGADATGVDSNYWDAVRAAIASHLRYPASARRRGVEGFASIRVTLDAAGRLLDAQPVEFTDRIFKEIAIEAAGRACPFPAPTNAPSDVLSAVLPIRFELRGGGVGEDALSHPQ